jgi:hypothetical protein
LPIDEGVQVTTRLNFARIFGTRLKDRGEIAATVIRSFCSVAFAHRRASSGLPPR